MLKQLLPHVGKKVSLRCDGRVTRYTVTGVLVSADTSKVVINAGAGNIPLKTTDVYEFLGVKGCD